MALSSIDQPDLIGSAWCTDQELMVSLKDGRTIIVPLWWYPRLLEATPVERAKVEIGRFGLHWPAIDEDIELAGLLVAAKAPGAEKPTGQVGRKGAPRVHDRS